MQQHQLDRRIRKMLEVLEQMSVMGVAPVEGLQIAPRGSDAWRDFQSGDVWGPPEGEWFDFRLRAVTPQGFRGRTVLEVRTGREGLWEGINPQLLAWVDGAIEQGLDTRHCEILLSDAPQPGRAWDVSLEGYAAAPEGGQPPARLFARLLDVDAEVRALAFDLRAPWEAACLCPEGDRERERTLIALSDALNLLDLRDPHSAAFDASVRAARAFLKAEYYDRRRDIPSVAVADCVGHTHIDCAWLWDLYQSRHKAARTFATVLKLMERYPEFVFMSSQPLLYQFVKEDRPELYRRIREAVDAGRWQPEGGMWVEADCNIPSGESLVRQFLHGQEFFLREFGQRSRVLWLPDVFGYSAALPQIMKGAGIDYFMTSKLSWSEFNLYPYDTFMWRGIDGSEVLTHFTPARDADSPSAEADLAHYTTYNAMLSPSQLRGGWQRFQQKALDDHFIVSYGYGDGGGGPTDWMIENARRMAVPLPGSPVARQCMPRAFFEQLEARVGGDPRLPKWSGELYLEYHRGTYTAMARNKRFNRKLELLLRDAEFLCSWAARDRGQEYPAEGLHALWETALTLQFHDILPGSSIKKVYDDALEMYTDAMRRAEALRDGALSALAGGIRGDVVAFNTLSRERDDVIFFDAPGDACALADGDGGVFPVQFVEGRACAYVKGIPALGAKGFSFVSGERAGDTFRVDEKGFDTPFFRGTFDAAMRITSLVDKRCGRELCKGGEALNRIVCYENRPHNYDAWDVNIYYDQRKWDVDDVRGVELVSEGPVLKRLRVRWAFNRSTITQDVTFYADVPRVDFDTTVDWREEHLMLKASFPVDVFYNDATFDIQYGNVRRPTHKNTSWDVARFEVCAHKWVDVSEADYGFSLMNDCKYGCSVDEDGVALTLLKSSSYPNPEADREVHRFTYAIMPHGGDWRVAGTPQMAYRLNVPVLMAPGADRGIAAAGFASVDRENVIVEAVKRQLEGEDTIIRLYECHGARTEATLTLDRAPGSVCQVNLLEDDLGPADAEEGKVRFTLRPYEIRTFRVVW